MSKYPKDGQPGISPANLIWLTGDWKGRHGPDQVEEQWSAAGGGTLMAMFRWITEGRVRFYEFITIEQQGEQVLMRIKHFSPGLKGWEGKDRAVEFLLVQLRDREAVFLQLTKIEQWLIYRREADDRLVVYFEKEDEAVLPEDVFDFRLVR